MKNEQKLQKIYKIWGNKNEKHENLRKNIY